jgi:hypothetical protein
MKNLLSSALLLSLSLLSLPAPAAPQAVGAKVYAGDPSLEVTVIQLKEPDKYLIHVTGSRSTMDGLVLPYTVDSTGHNFSTTWRGSGYNLFCVESWHGNPIYKLYATDDLRVGHPVTYNEARSKLVKINELIALHEKQTKDGTIDRFGRFDRAGEQASHEKELTRIANAFNEDCHTKITATIAWSGIDDELIKSISISGYCDSPLVGMRRLCDSRAARAEIQARVKQYTCRFGKEQTLELDPKGTLVFTTFKGGRNAEESTKNYWENFQLTAEPAKPADKGAGEMPPWGQVRTLAQKMALENTLVCTDSKSAYVVRAPLENTRFNLYYGDGKTFARVPSPATGVWDGYFLDPRQYNPNGNSNMRGIDLRHYSEVEFETSKQTCSVRCGTRKSGLKILDEKTATDLLLAAKFTPPVHKRKPHVLTRDDRGVYYYVDRGNTPDTERDFKLYVGPRGSLKLKIMTNVVSDSEGEIFSTKGGSLRFIAGPGGSGASWVQGKTVTKLTAIPVEHNLQVIYNDLEVYRGQRLGMPCDDL